MRIPLRLKEENVYFAGKNVYWRDDVNDKGMAPEDVIVLRRLHLGASVLLIAVCLVGYYKPWW